MGTPVTVPMVGKIVSVSVKVGDKIKEDDQGNKDPNSRTP
jgi:biotin carboxyl carrier protein